jgi:CRISPR-associated protein Cmr4
MEARLLFVHALSPLHAGTGQGVGVIDLPIARERANGLPYLPGSSLKGVLRDSPDALLPNGLREKIFGPPTTQAETHAGSVNFSDQRLLLLPVRSLVGTFAWVTSPYILQRLARDARAMDISGLPAIVPQNPTGVEQCFVPEGSRLISSSQVLLEDLDLQPDAAGQQLATGWADWVGCQLFPGTNATNNDGRWRQGLTERFCIVHDDLLSFLLDTAIEIIARIALMDDTKTVKEGQLRYEEALPCESVLYGLVTALPIKKFASELTSQSILTLVAALTTKAVQLGGKATVGRGLCQLRLAL